MFEYLKFSLTVRCCSNTIQNNLEIRSHLVLVWCFFPCPAPKKKVVPSSVLRHGHECVLVYYVSGCICVCTLGKKRHRDVVDL